MNTAIQSRSALNSVFQDANTYVSGICFIWIDHNNHNLLSVSWDLYRM